MWYPRTAESKVNFSNAQRTPKLCPRILPTCKAWLLSTRSFCFNGELYSVFWSDNLEKSDQKSILSWRRHKFKREKRYNKWNFAFFRLKCERWQQLLHRCLETVIVCRSLFVYSNTTLLELQTLLFLFFSKICASKLGVGLIYGCSLYTDVYGRWDSLVPEDVIEFSLHVSIYDVVSFTFHCFFNAPYYTFFRLSNAILNAAIAF